MKSLKSKVLGFDTYEQINANIKDAAKGETAYLVTCGPSLTSHNREELIKKLDGKLVIACKQAYEYVKEVATIHLLSVYNYQPYEYHSEETIRHWQLTAMNAQNEAERIKNGGREWICLYFVTLLLGSVNINQLLILETLRTGSCMQRIKQYGVQALCMSQVFHWHYI